MQRLERFVCAAMLLTSAGFASAAGLDIYHQRQAKLTALEGQLLPVQAAEVIGSHPDFRGDPRSPYTLVEFGDYQCPPCRAINPLVDVELKRYPSKLRFVFRNLPLTRIHPDAMPAAVLAESARGKDCFWQVHDALYQGPMLDADSFTEARKIAYPSEHSADKALQAQALQDVQADMREAQHIGLHGTPSFLLCFPNGQVRQLRALDQVDASLR